MSDLFQNSFPPFPLSSGKLLNVAQAGNYFLKTLFNVKKSNKHSILFFEWNPRSTNNAFPEKAEKKIFPFANFTTSKQEK